MAEPTPKKGSKGQEVRDLQEALETLGFSPGKVDGIFGPATWEVGNTFEPDLAASARP